jgi:hypothetical protein
MLCRVVSYSYETEILLYCRGLKLLQSSGNIIRHMDLLIGAPAISNDLIQETPKPDESKNRFVLAVQIFNQSLHNCQLVSCTPPGTPP